MVGRIYGDTVSVEIVEFLVRASASDCDCIPCPEDCDYATFMNPYYATPPRMQKNIAILRKAAENMVATGLVTGGAENSPLTVKWGYYQPIIVPQKCWPERFYDPWDQSVKNTRRSLSKVDNYDAIFCPPYVPGESGTDATFCNTPKTKLDLLDALVNICFNKPASGETKPGIPMVISVTSRRECDRDRDYNDISFCWDIGPDAKPKALYLTMICPYDP